MANATFDAKSLLVNWIGIAAPASPNPAKLLYSNFDGSHRIDSAYSATDSLTDVVVEIGVSDLSDISGSYSPVFRVTVPSGAGFGTLPMADLLALGLPESQTGLFMQPKYCYTYKVISGLGEGKKINFIVMGGEL